MKKISVLTTKWQILLIIIISLIVWRPILNQIPMGEGYYYFDRCQNKLIVPADCPTTIWQYDNLARISFQIMIPLFKDNIHYYMFAQFGIMLLLYITLFLVLLKITKDHFFALSTVLLFLTNYTGSFSMMAIGNYQRFAQRVPNLIPILISFYYLTKYFDTNKLNNIYKSIVFYIIGFFLAHHSIFMLPIFIAYVLLKIKIKKIKLKSIILNLALISIFTLVSFTLSRTDHLAPKQGIINFLLNTPNILEKTFLQIPNLFVPTEMVRFIAKNWPISPIPYPFTFILEVFAPPIFILLLILLFIIKNDSNKNILLKSAIVALPIVSFLNLYAYGDGAPHPLRDFGEDRIYFIASIYSSIVLGYLLTWTYNQKKYIFKIISITLLCISIYYNSSLINRDSMKLTANVKKMDQFINYIKRETSDKNMKIAIIGPSHLLWPIQFATLFYNQNNNLVFALDSSEWNDTLKKTDFDKIKIIDYKYNKIIEKQIK